MLKKIFLSVVIVLVAYSSEAQFYKSLLPSPEFNSALQKIVSDFRYNFKHILGDTLSIQSGAATFTSTVKLPGASECIIYKFHSVIDTTASWQAVMYDGDDYKEAVKAYKNTFRLMNKSRMELIDKSVIGFSGTLEEPGEDLRFTVSTLQLDIQDNRYNRFRGEVELVSTFGGWKVHVNLNDVKPDYERQ